MQKESDPPSQQSAGNSRSGRPAPRTDADRAGAEYQNRGQTLRNSITESKSSLAYPNWNDNGTYNFQNTTQLQIPGIPTSGGGGKPSVPAEPQPQAVIPSANTDLKDQPQPEASKKPDGKSEKSATSEEKERDEVKRDAKGKANAGEEVLAKGIGDAKADLPAPAPQVQKSSPAPIPGIAIHLGSMRPQWVRAPNGSEELVLVRAARVGPTTVYQGVVLDWPQLSAVLQEEVKDLFPDAKLIAVRSPSGVSPERAMTALPVQLDPGLKPAHAPIGWTPLRMGLVMSWAAALIAFAAVGLSGWSLIALAERRIRFVSAVTHELRTPLTSLRLYLDLLLSGMVTDEAKRTEYLATLNMESERLHRLIDNVLDFARLENRRTQHQPQPIRVTEILEHARLTWTDRCAADGKQLTVTSQLDESELVSTDLHLMQQVVGNLIDNSRKYSREATDPHIWLSAQRFTPESIALEVEDRGPGVPLRERSAIFKPFRRGAGCRHRRRRGRVGAGTGETVG